ncbi:MAG: IclR family transcriptional regulator [Actinomycetes bacterium]
MSNATVQRLAPGRPTAAVQSVDRAITVLEILARAGEAGVTEIAVEIQVHKSTAFRLLSVLEDRGLVEQVGDRGKYRLGHGIIRLAGATTARMDLVTGSRPITEKLAREIGETINVAILSGAEALYIDQVAATSALRSHNWVGQRIPLHCTSNGKVLLAYMRPDQLAAVLGGQLHRFTPRTVVDPGKLREQLHEVRSRGYAIAAQELEIGLVAVAAAVRDMDGNVVGTVSISGPSSRLSTDRLSQLGVRVRQAGLDISRRIGWHG